MNHKNLFATKLPVIQAPMAGVQGSTLAIAVCNAGGLGSLACAMLDVDTMRKELAAIKAQTDQPFNVNFFCHQQPPSNTAREAAWRTFLTPYYQELDIDPNSSSTGAGRNPFSDQAADVLSEFKPAVVSFHFGLPPKELMARVRSWGAKIISSATTLEEALWLEEQGVDAIIAQGVEAGGHRGMFLTEDLNSQIATVELLPQIIRVVRVPVIAAGGIANASDVAKAMALGAVAVQVGTAYLLCPEVTTSKVHRAALKSTADTVMTNLFTGRPARAIVNRFIKECGPINSAVPAFPLAAAAVTPLRMKAESRGSGDFSPLWAGKKHAECKEFSAAEITRELVAQVS